MGMAMAMGSPSRSRGRRLAVALLLLWVAGCLPRETSVTVSGKTAYGDLAVEGAAVSALRLEAGVGTPVGSTRSGYHGSWILRLPPGTYRLEAEGSLPAAGGGALSLSGVLGRVHVAGDEGRVDRLLISLEPTGGSPP